MENKEIGSGDVEVSYLVLPYLPDWNSYGAILTKCVVLQTNNITYDFLHGRNNIDVGYSKK